MVRVPKLTMLNSAIVPRDTSELLVKIVPQVTDARVAVFILVSANGVTAMVTVPAATRNTDTVLTVTTTPKAKTVNVVDPVLKETPDVVLPMIAEPLPPSLHVIATTTHPEAATVMADVCFVSTTPKDTIAKAAKKDSMEMLLKEHPTIAVNAPARKIWNFTNS